MKIAIDGPSGSGKSTVAKAVAKALGIIYVDTGALYRTVGLYVKEKGVAKADKAGIVACLPEIEIELRYEDGKQLVLLNGENPKDKIRTPEISMYASAVSAIPEVREFLLMTQKNIAAKNSVIMDGRDIGTVIMPDADVKIFMSASSECRARRRFDELIAKGEKVTFEAVLSDMEKRDEYDRKRDIAPATAAPDAILYDNTGIDIEQNVANVLEIINNKIEAGKTE